MQSEKTQTMDEILHFTCILLLFSQNLLIAAYTLTPSQSIRDGQTLTSQGGKFELGFFSPSSSSKNRYLAIWYKTIPVQTAVWVANRESPVPNTSGVLKIDTTGNIIIVDGKGSFIWSTNSSNTVEDPIIEFLGSGNLVVREARNADPDSYLWQSFDYPGNTILPGMKFGWNLESGINRYLSSWRNIDDPSRGDFTCGIELAGYPQLITRKESKKYYRSGSWNGISFYGSPDLQPNLIFTFDFIQNAEEVFFRFQLINQSTILHYVLVQRGTEGRLERSIWVDNTNSWSLLLSMPRNHCDEYGLCGNYGICDETNVFVCQCLKGFKPKSPEDWNAADWSKGCEREVPLNCSNGEGFRKYTRLKLPETTSSGANTSMTLEECRLRCLSNCSCMAYSNLDITGSGNGCIMWFTDLIDIKQFSSGGQDLYIRLSSSALDSETNSRRKRSITIIASVAALAGAVVLGFASWCIWKKSGSKGDIDRDDLELPLYSLATLSMATNNFSAENKLGEGGFGPVYKGKLEEGQDIAVKRLSKDSTQGVDAFMNEVKLISKLQHRNLVNLFGCCIQRDELMLVFEYMPNNSLGTFIFDETKRKLLDWQKRLQIIQGIAEGLLYLHRYSRLRIIHRDLKASNVLLDNELAPKIADFGMARIFGGEQIEAKTKRVVGTYGYMSPEYMIDGHFSAKSDVFSFGVLLLEIISGKKNWGFRHPDHELNLLGHAWTLFSADKSLEFVDKLMIISPFDQVVLRYMHVGLLCVQKETEQRPTMSSVVLMLSSEIASLPKPQLPGFYMERSPIAVMSPYNCKDPPNSNDFSITLIEGR